MIVDNYPFARIGVRSILQRDATFEVVAEAWTGEKAIALGTNLPGLDLVILDIDLPDRSGIEVLRCLVSKRPSLRVLVLSVYEATHYAMPAMQSGASGYMMKARGPMHLLATLRRIISGEVVIPREAARQLLQQQEQAGGQSSSLSAREIDVLRLMATGLRTAEIAERLCVSMSTVRTYRQRLKQKTGASSTAELYRYAFQQEISSSTRGLTLQE